MKYWQVLDTDDSRSLDYWNLASSIKKLVRRYVHTRAATDWSRTDTRQELATKTPPLLTAAPARRGAGLRAADPCLRVGLCRLHSRRGPLRRARQPGPCPLRGGPAGPADSLRTAAAVGGPRCGLNNANRVCAARDSEDYPPRAGTSCLTEV